MLACFCLLFRLLGVPSAILTPDVDTTFTSIEHSSQDLLSTRCVQGRPSFLFSSIMSTHREDSPNHTASEQPTEVEIKKISVNATYHTVAKADSSKKKKAAAKTTTKTKNKEIYLLPLLLQHPTISCSCPRFCPSMGTKNTRQWPTAIAFQFVSLFHLQRRKFPLLCINMYPGVDCSKKDAVDIDTLPDFQDLVKKLIENDINKLTVFYDLDDVKRAAKVLLSLYTSASLFSSSHSTL